MVYARICNRFENRTLDELIMANSTLSSCIYFMYVRAKYKFIPAHNPILYAHNFGIPEVNKNTYMYRTHWKSCTQHIENQTTDIAILFLKNRNYRRVLTPNILRNVKCKRWSYQFLDRTCTNRFVTEGPSRGKTRGRLNIDWYSHPIPI